MIYHLILTLCLLLKIAKDSSQFRFPVSGHHRLNRTAWLAALATPPYGVQHLARCMGKNGLSINRWYKPFWNGWVIIVLPTLYWDEPERLGASLSLCLCSLPLPQPLQKSLYLPLSLSQSHCLFVFNFSSILCVSFWVRFTCLILLLTSTIPLPCLRLSGDVTMHVLTALAYCGIAPSRGLRFFSFSTTYI